MKNVVPSCPVCRFPLQFKTCRHAIAAIDPYEVDKVAPPVLKGDKSDIPMSCSACNIANLPKKRNFRMLEANKAELQLEVARLDAEIDLLLERKKAIPKDKPELLAQSNNFVVQRVNQRRTYANALQANEKSLVGSEKIIEEELDLFMKQLNEKPVWHLKVETEQWPVPAEEVAVGNRFGFWDDEDDEDYDDEHEPGEDDNMDDEIDMDDREGGSLYSGGGDSEGQASGDAEDSNPQQESGGTAVTEGLQSVDGHGHWDWRNNGAYEEYMAQQESGGAAAAAASEGLRPGNWANNAAIYQWSDEYGDIGPRHPEVEMSGNVAAAEEGQIVDHTEQTVHPNQIQQGGGGNVDGQVLNNTIAFPVAIGNAQMPPRDLAFAELPGLGQAVGNPDVDEERLSFLPPGGQIVVPADVLQGWWDEIEGMGHRLQD